MRMKAVILPILGFTGDFEQTFADVTKGCQALMKKLKERNLIIFMAGVKPLVNLEFMINPFFIKIVLIYYFIFIHIFI